METIIRPLSPELLDDFLYFFDHVAFADHPEWQWCYCTFFHLGKQDEQRLEEESSRCTRDVLRNVAIDLINTGVMRGYLAYADGQVVGWCNASDKRGYKKLCENRDIWDGDDAKAPPVKVVTCFIVAPTFRRKGVAAALLNRVLQDAAAEGCQVLEAYPAAGELDCFGHYHGHPAMYEACGFKPYRQLDGYSIYRKTL